MRQAADILSSAPAMQIRYLEAMQAMAKSANSKVIFLPAANQTMPGSAAFNAQLAKSNAEDDGPSYSDFGSTDPAFMQAMNAKVVESI